MKLRIQNTRSTHHLHSLRDDRNINTILQRQNCRPRKKIADSKAERQQHHRFNDYLAKDGGRFHAKGQHQANFAYTFKYGHDQRVDKPERER